MRVLFKSGHYFILVSKGCGYNSRAGIIRERVLITRVRYAKVNPVKSFGQESRESWHISIVEPLTISFSVFVALVRILFIFLLSVLWREASSQAFEKSASSNKANLNSQWILFQCFTLKHKRRILKVVYIPSRGNWQWELNLKFFDLFVIQWIE